MWVLQNGSRCGLKNHKINMGLISLQRPHAYEPEHVEHSSDCLASHGRVKHAESVGSLNDATLTLWQVTYTGMDTEGDFAPH